MNHQAQEAHRARCGPSRGGALEQIIEWRGMPQQNAYVERYHRTMRYAWLAQTLFDLIEPMQDTATRWLWTYNHECPNMALGGSTPMLKLTLAA